MLIVAGDHVLTDPRAGTVLRDGAVLVADGRVVETGPLATMQSAHPEAEVLGGAGRLVMPGLIDAHSHGRGLSPIQKGVPYDYLENAFLDWSSMVYLPNELCAALSAVRHLRMGCTAIHHTGWNDEGHAATGEARKAVNAYKASGIRLAYSPAVRNRNRFVPDEPGFLRSLPPDLAEWMRPTLTYDADKIEHDYFDQFEALSEDYETGAGRPHAGAAGAVLGAWHDRAVPAPRARSCPAARRPARAHPHAANSPSARVRVQGIWQVVSGLPSR